MVAFPAHHSRTIRKHSAGRFSPAFTYFKAVVAHSTAAKTTCLRVGQPSLSDIFPQSHRSQSPRSHVSQTSCRDFPWAQVRPSLQAQSSLSNAANFLEFISAPF